MYKALTKEDTNVLKGVALLLLLFHHLFYINDGMYDDIIIAENGLIQTIGEWCKICVAIFVFLSGYGLTVQAEKNGGIFDLKQFYWHRFTKLMMNYWFIWLIFVPISVFGFNLTFSNIYEDHVVIKFILDFAGLISAVGTHGYNPTWWFFSCIILLYLLFPYLYNILLKKDMLLSLVIIALVTYLPIPLFPAAKNYIPVFFMGILFCRNSINLSPNEKKREWGGGGVLYL